MTKGYLAMLTLSVAVTAVSVGSLSYIVIAQPDYLHADRDGVPFYTPQVINPEGGEPLNMGELIRHYKGE
ncbi:MULTISPECIES: hypothetical protein [Sedimenticola]|uniref:Uncharacterized protein n=1 Tax=Sedimenticola selenatireducens TaxID=191960 RepID=A0A2N6CSS1_9GAMM|nr:MULTISPECIES: hypothetical protein [Sedimenticola]MCW8904990.1 hypothetical protein [Sedimenticola sp.]PLX60166.1 MAG: hypothetical protein C0630_16720 [Sedimenticola selenatireducens]